MCIVKVAIGGSCIYLMLVRIEGMMNKKTKQEKKRALDVNKAYMFDVSIIVKIFNYLVNERFITYLMGHYIPFSLKIKGKKYYRYHNVWTHSTLNS